MKRIPLLLRGADEVGYRAWPVTQGVPFADGELARGMPVRVVDEQGEALPTQASCLTTWHKDQKYVKWLLIDFQADLSAGRERTLFLEYGPGAQPPPCDSAVQVAEEPGRVTVDTGALRMELCAGSDEGALVMRCAVPHEGGWRDAFRKGASPRLYMRDQHGKQFDSLTPGPQPSVVVEEAGPMCACVRVKGYHTMPPGRRFCPYILRLHFFAGKADVRIHHTFIFDQDPEQVELAAIGVDLPLDLGDVSRGAVGGSEATHADETVQRLEFVQLSDMEYRVTAHNRTLGEGSRPSGWAGLTGVEGSAVAVIRNQWQEYPKGFVVTPAGIDVQIWPEACGETLKFTTPFKEEAIFLRGVGTDEEEFKRLVRERPDAPINLKSYDPSTTEKLVWIESMVEKHASGHPVSHDDTGTGNGFGAAKTTEIFLRLDPTPIPDADVEALARAVQEPLIAPADPAHTCSTRALGHAHHAGDPRFAETDAGLDDSLDMLMVQPAERCRLYGMMRYGNAPCSHAPGPGMAYAHYVETEPEKALRFVGSFNNEAYDMIMGTWGHFIRTGRRDHYFGAQDYSRCVADVAFFHADPDPDHPLTGLMRYHNAHVWSGGASPSHSLLTGILTDYYFTGNRRLLDVARENAERAVKLQEPSGIIANRHGALHREFTGPLWDLMEVYQATWDERYGDLARRSLNWFLRTLPRPGAYPISIYTRGERGDEAVVDLGPDQPSCKGHPREIYPLFEIALRLFDSQALRDHVIAEADSYVWEEYIDRYMSIQQAVREQPPGRHAWPVDDEFCWTNTGRVWGTYRYAAGPVCLAYDLTGDVVYAAYAKHLIEHSFRRQMNQMRRLAFFDFSHLWYGSGILRLMGIVADALDKDPEALAKAEADWLERRAQLGLPVYTGSGVDLTVDTMEASGEITSRPPADLPFEGTTPERKGDVSLGRLSTEDHPRPQ